MKTPGKLGMTVLGLWLILTGLSPWVHITIPGWSTLTALMALVAGVLLLLGR